jgi:thiol-disulfide isomerase/thioredoxin
MTQHSFNNTKVYHLEPSDFSSTGKTITVKGQKIPGITLVFVWASYCGHCLKAMQAISDLARKYNSNKVNSNSITIASVQGDSNDKLDKETLAILQKLTAISGYPTILIFKDGEFSGIYNGDRSASAIDSHLRAI